MMRQNRCMNEFVVLVLSFPAVRILVAVMRRMIFAAPSLVFTVMLGLVVVALCVVFTVMLGVVVAALFPVIALTRTSHGFEHVRVLIAGTRVDAVRDNPALVIDTRSVGQRDA